MNCPNLYHSDIFKKNIYDQIGLQEYERNKLEKWTHLKINTVIFDSEIDDWNNYSNDFPDKISNKQHLVFLIETKDGVKFGGFLSNHICKSNEINESNEITTFLNEPIYGASNGSIVCKLNNNQIINTSGLLEGTHTVTCNAISNSGLSSSDVTLTITVSLKPGLSDAAKALAEQIAALNVGDNIGIQEDEKEGNVYTPTIQYYLLAKETDRALLMYYDDGGGGGTGLQEVFDETSNSWKDSSLRTYLNSTEESGFLGTKTVLNELIMETTIYTRSASNLNEFETTTDRVFIMSEADRLGTNQGVSITYASSPNDYTIEPGDDGNIIPDTVRMTGSGLYFELDTMWFRTPGSDGKVRYASTRNGGTHSEDNPTTQAIVLPMFWVDLSSVNS